MGDEQETTQRSPEFEKKRQRFCRFHRVPGKVFVDLSEGNELLDVRACDLTRRPWRTFASCFHKLVVTVNVWRRQQRNHLEQRGRKDQSRAPGQSGAGFVPAHAAAGDGASRLSVLLDETTTLLTR